MRDFHSSFRPQGLWKSLSFYICLSIAFGILGHKPGCRLFHDCPDGTDRAEVFWGVQSFSPLPYQRKVGYERRTPCRKANGDSTGTTPFPLYSGRDISNGDSGGISSGGVPATVVYSVFSKPSNKVFRELLEASNASASMGTAEILGLEDIYDVDNEKGKWDELTEMIEDGDLSVKEFQDLYKVAVNGGKGLNLERFRVLYQSIDDLFDDDDDEDSVEDNSGGDEAVSNTMGTISTELDSSNNTIDNDRNLKQHLLSYIEKVQDQRCGSDDGTIDVGERRPWGLDCSDSEREKIAYLIEELLEESRTGGSKSNDLNLLYSNKNGLPSSTKELAKYLPGTWNLLYTSSRTMIINQSLSGLGRSSSEMARNLGLKMKLRGTYYAGEVEFIETFGRIADNEIDSDDESFSFEAKVIGEWFLETGFRTDYKTGLPSVSLSAQLKTIDFGPTKNDAADWESLSPIKMLDLLYLDKNLLLMRGAVNPASIFVYTRR